MVKHKIVVVTGATGFIAKHVMVDLLRAGYLVRGTLRAPAKMRVVEHSMKKIVGTKVENLQLFQCDLLADAGWAEVMAGADAVMHLATVVPDREPKNSANVIRPALEGTERVLNFAIAAGIKRIVMTSSIAAIGYGQKSAQSLIELNAEDWTDVAGLKGGWAYPEAKTRAEKRAWEIAEQENIELTSICPSMVFGPAVDEDTSASLEVILRTMNGQVPALPPGGMSVVDVRDVAQIHVDVLSNVASYGKRIIASAQYISFLDVADILRLAYPDKKFPTAIVPVWLMKFLGTFDRTVKQIAADLDVVRHYDGAPATLLMGREYRNGKEAVLAAAESLVDLGMVKT